MTEIFRLRAVCQLILALLPVCASFGQADKSFLKEPQLIPDPGNYYKYSPDSRRFTGIPSLAITCDGRLYATWYAGSTPGEDANNYVVLATSDDAGRTWEEILVVDPDSKGAVRAFDPEIWVAPDNALWLFWAQTIGHDGTTAGVWAIKANDPESKTLHWTMPERLTDGVMMCKPTVLSNGDWLLPVSTWRLTAESAKAVVSINNGKSWTVRGACDVPEPDRNYDEHMIVERLDGSLWMLVRTRYGIGESVSEDAGRTWSELKPSLIAHTSSRFFVRRLQSGRLLLVKHGPILTKTGRSHLMAFVSDDDGITWSKGLLLDERSGASYPDGQQARDGTIYLTYDYSRTGAQHVLLTSFTEEGILSADHDEQTVKVYNNRRIISQGGR